MFIMTIINDSFSYENRMGSPKGLKIISISVRGKLYWRGCFPFSHLKHGNTDTLSWCPCLRHMLIMICWVFFRKEKPLVVPHQLEQDRIPQKGIYDFLSTVVSFQALKSYDGEILVSFTFLTKPFITSTRTRGWRVQLHYIIIYFVSKLRALQT